MAFTFDPTTNEGKVRLLLADTDTADATKQVFTDAEIDAFLSLADNSILLAAAYGADSVVSSATRVAVMYRAVGFTIDRRDIPKTMRLQAEVWRKQANDIPDEFFDHVDDNIILSGWDASEYSGESL